MVGCGDFMFYALDKEAIKYTRMPKVTRGARNPNLKIAVTNACAAVL